MYKSGGSVHYLHLHDLDLYGRDRDWYPGENRGEYYMDVITPEIPDVRGFWIYHIMSMSSGMYGGIGYISDIACDISEYKSISRTYHMIYH